MCFRRREVRQIRKTRGRDAHSAEKLKKLRKELEESRQILGLIRQREITKREQLAVERQLFEQRTSLRQVKQNLPEQYKEGDEDILVNQKVKQSSPQNPGSCKISHRLTLKSRKRRSHWKLPPSVHRERSLGFLRDRMVELQKQISFFCRIS